MLDLKWIVKETKTVEDSLKKRGAEDLVPKLVEIIELDKQRKSIIQEVEALKHQKNEASKKIGELKRQGGDDSLIREEMKKVAERTKDLDSLRSEVEAKLDNELPWFPNVLNESVPEGKDETKNLEVRNWGQKPEFTFTPKFHYEIGERMGIIDFKKAGEVTGARFAFLKGLGAKLERALINYFLDSHAKAGYEEMLPPLIVNRDALFGTGQLPKFEQDVFAIKNHEYFLIPTAEVPVTNYHRHEILESQDLPKKYMAFTPCFRSEAGSYGKDTKGLKRQHQFNKVELVQFVKPEESSQALEALTNDAERILQSLKLPYRVVKLCGGDTGFSSSMTYDIEVWSPAHQGYMEISSCSNFTEFQARRAMIRYRSEKDKKVHFLHTLNGSGLAVGRTLIAIIENYQKSDGTFEIPDVLKPYVSNS